VPIPVSHFPFSRNPIIWLLLSRNKQQVQLQSPLSLTIRLISLGQKENGVVHRQYPTSLAFLLFGSAEEEEEEWYLDEESEERGVLCTETGWFWWEDLELEPYEEDWYTFEEEEEAVVYES